MQYCPLNPEFFEINRVMGPFTHLPKPDLPKMKAKTFPDGKRFYTTPEGKTYPSITTMLGHKEKPWLEDWRNSLGREKADKETKRAGERGEAIHRLIELYLANTLTSDITRPLKPEYVNGFNQVKLRLNKIDNIRIQEAALYSDVIEVAGRVDCIGEYEGVLSIVDFKTSSNVKDRAMIEDYYLQCTAYALMWQELTGEEIKDIVIIMSVEKGMVPLVFKEKVHKYISPLRKRILQYYEDHK
jgi:genome maintenance exonuclease 1